MQKEDEYWAKLAIEESRKCKPEDQQAPPKVGAVVVKDGELLAAAYRGEEDPGDHAEFIALEKKLAEGTLADATVYTTLEPCTTRNHPKVPCARRLVERRVARVVIGMLDPNPQIQGEGIGVLREAGIAVDLFSSDLMKQIEELNRDFIRAQKGYVLEESESAEQISQRTERGLDGWYKKLNRVYWNRNSVKTRTDIFSHLVEVIGGLSHLASSKSKPGVTPDLHLCKAVAWWLALCGQAGVKSVEDMLWDKFPGVCAYCHQETHDPNICEDKKAEATGPQWNTLDQIGQRGSRPKRLGEWQVMFARIYPAQQTEDYGPSFARLAEELGELAEAVRVYPAEPGYLLSEASDVFAWLMHIQNILESKRRVRLDDRGKEFERQFALSYPDGCRDCGQRNCTCPPILGSTIGRISHEVPPGKGGYGAAGRFMTPDESRRVFRGLN